MEEKSIKVFDSNKTFIVRITDTLNKLLLPTKVGLNSMLISLKRVNLLKSFENYIEKDSLDNVDKKEVLSKKYEDSFSLYLEAIDKYVMDSIYKKVRNDTASLFEKEALSKYYVISHLKETEYLEYKYKKQKYLLELDYENIKLSDKLKLLIRYNKFYINKMDLIYKGLLKHYSIQLADSLITSQNYKSEVYNKIFESLEEYITNILPIKIKNNKQDDFNLILDKYDEFNRFTVGKLDKKDYIEKNMLLLAISRQLFTHSLPLIAAEQCYIKLLKDSRDLVADTKIYKKRENAYSLLINVIEEYKVNLLGTKIYWDKPSQREEFKEFWNKYKKISELKTKDYIKYLKEKEILFIREDLKQLNDNKKDYTRILKFYKNKLVELGAMRQLKNSAKTYNFYTKNKNSSSVLSLKGDSND